MRGDELEDLGRCRPRTVELLQALEVGEPDNGADGLAAPGQSLMGFARFDYRLNDRTVWFASMDRFQQNKNDYVPMPLSRNRFMTGIEFSLSSERDRRTNRLNEDALYVPITDHTAGRRDRVD